MILFCGILSETPIVMVRDHLDKIGVPYVIFNQRNFMNMDINFEIKDNLVFGLLNIGGKSYRLEDFQGVYTRLMDTQFLPEIKNETINSSKRKYCRAVHDTLMQWYEITPARVVNRTAPMASNFSKPYQAQLIIKHEFAIPPTLITNVPELVFEFYQIHKQVIYKSISGTRSIVQTLNKEDLERLDHIRWCPTQFQKYVEGTNVRVHVVNKSVFATAVTTDTTDYRYAHQEGGDTELRAIEISDELAERCVKLSQALGLAFTGIDLKITPDDQIYCFEVNPSPAFTYYESETGQPIAEAVARYLAGLD